MHAMQVTFFVVIYLRHTSIYVLKQGLKQTLYYVPLFHCCYILYCDNQDIVKLTFW